ncbi:MAG TPA: hypothetical protein VN323_22330 [Candidatus Dormibacteraeota bacterium]|jgi:hypothetical protein|nr:hypothetical protein [Candidatus Dormibacteraeota bacterium]
MASHPRYLREGVIAGLIGAAVVAVWFLIYDAASGRPFRTPALLGAATFEGVKDPAAVPTVAALVLPYTVLHGVVFAMVGVLIAYLIVSAQREPSRVLMLFIAVMCFEIFFLAVVTWLAHPVLDEVQWWTILVANALAAFGMLTYLIVGQRALGRALLGPLWTRAVREGIWAGLLGAAAVAVWFLAYDAATGAPFRTPALLGGALFHGLRDPNALVVSAPLVLQYTVVHGAAFIAFGLLTAGLLALADREPRVLFAVLMLYCCFEVFFAALVTILAEWLLEAVPWWTIVAGNLLASVVMIGFLLREHRLAWREFLHARR